MAARDWVVRWFGEGVAQKIERFVEGTLFGDTFVTCPQCQRQIAVALISERQICPVCQEKATNEMMIEALEAEKKAVLAAGEAAINKVNEIDRRLLEMRKKG